MSKSKEEIEKILKDKLYQDYFDFNATVFSVEYDPETETAVIKTSVHIVEEDDYVGFESY